MDPITTCTHIKTNGIVCGSPALRDHQLCYFHHQAKSRDELRYAVGFPFDPTIHVGSLEDPESVQLAINEIVHALLDRRLDTARAKVVLYALQLAITNFKRMDNKVDTSRMATVLPEQPKRSQESRADWPCKNEADEHYTPIHASADESSVATSRGPFKPAVGLSGDIPSNSKSPSAPSVSSNSSLDQSNNSSIDSRIAFARRIAPLPAHIQRDLLAADAGDRNAVKRLLKLLPKTSSPLPIRL